jgi:hypothetical protein
MVGESRSGRKRKPSTKPRDNPAQSERFIEAAKKLTDESGEAFEKAMGVILKPKQKPPKRAS